MATPSPAPGIFLDGTTASQHAVTVEVAEGLACLRLRDDKTLEETLWPLDTLRQIEAGSRQLVLTQFAPGHDEQLRDAARLTLTDSAMIAWIRAQAPHLTRRDMKSGTLGKVTLWVGGAMAALGLILFVFLPLASDQLAARFSPEREAAFGDAIAGQVEFALGGKLGEGLTCDAPAGVAALEKLRLALTSGRDTGYALRLRVLDHDMVNALALPGGQIIILRGFLDAAESPAELAGVLGHEIGHVEARDPTRLALRAAGSAGILSLIFGDMSGGLVLGLVSSQVLSGSYTRAAEARADDFAFALMSDTGIGTAGLAAFFARIDGLDGNLPDYLSSHPASENRALRARNADIAAKTPPLTAADWAALKAICDG